jgi:hypothetical protein
MSEDTTGQPNATNETAPVDQPADQAVGQAGAEQHYAADETMAAEEPQQKPDTDADTPAAAGEDGNGTQ